MVIIEIFFMKLGNNNLKFCDKCGEKYALILSKDNNHKCKNNNILK